MKPTAVFLIAMVAIYANAAPAPYPITINSRAASAPPITAARAGEQTYRATFVDGATASDVTGHTLWMSWSTNEYAATVSTASVSVVTATNGVVDFTFAPAALNYAPGRYWYEIGVATGATVRVYQHGVLTIRGSPYATGADPVTWSTNWNIALVTLTGTIPLANLSGITSNEMDSTTVAAFLASGGGATYTGGTNIDVNGTVINLDAAAVASLALADSAVQTNNAVLTNAAALAASALQPSDTNGWEVGSHASFGTGDVSQAALAAATGTVYVAATNDAIGVIDGRGYLTEETLWIAESNSVLAHVASAANPHTVTLQQAADAQGTDTVHGAFSVIVTGDVTAAASGARIVLHPESTQGEEIPWMLWRYYDGDEYWATNYFSPLYGFVFDYWPMRVASLVSSGDIVPTLSNTYSLGSAEKPWKDVFVSTGTVHIGSVQLKADDTKGDLVLTAQSEPEVIATKAWVETNSLLASAFSGFRDWSEQSIAYLWYTNAIDNAMDGSLGTFGDSYATTNLIDGTLSSGWYKDSATGKPKNYQDLDPNTNGAAGLVGGYHLDNSAINFVTGTTGTVNGAAAYSTTRRLGTHSLSVTAGGGYFTAAPGITSASAFTLMGWFRFSNTTVADRMFVNSGPTVECRMVGAADKTLRFILNGSTLSGPSALSLNKWYHIAFWWNGANAMRIYVDGQLHASGAGGGSSAFTIGTTYVGGSSTLNMYGYVDELEFYNAALAQAVIQGRAIESLNHMILTADQTETPELERLRLVILAQVTDGGGDPTPNTDISANVLIDGATNAVTLAELGPSPGDSAAKVYSGVYTNGSTFSNIAAQVVCPTNRKWRVNAWTGIGY